MPLTVGPQHWWQMNATWNEWNLTLIVRAVFHAWQLLEKSESLQQVFTVSSPTAWETKILCRVDSTCAQQWPKSYVCSCHYLSAALEKWRQCVSRLHLNCWWVVDVLIWPSSEVRECWMACQKSPRKKIVWGSQGALKVMHNVFQPKWACVRPSSANWLTGSGQ